MTSYAGNIGVGFDKYDRKYNGPFGLRGGMELIALSRITDGTSQTAAMAEWHLGLLPINIKASRSNRMRLTFETPRALLEEFQLDEFAVACRDVNIDKTSILGVPAKGWDWLYVGVGHMDGGDVATDQ